MRSRFFITMSLATALLGGNVLQAAEPKATEGTKHTFTVGENDFLLDGKRLQIRCGEIHFARVPHEYWRHRLKLMKAMGLNAVCAYLFWNLHEPQRGQYDWTGPADAAEFCRIAQEEGLWVVLRPGPYACAEWDGGGLPWWLLKNPDIKLRSQDPDFIAASQAWLKEVGRVLGPLQVTRGGNILLVQAENEYGSYGNDATYMGLIRQALIDGGFDVPLFACNPPNALKNGLRSDLFQVVNFGRDPEAGFKALRQVQPTGPLMCGEFYPGWFDTWGAPHHLGNTKQYLEDLETMLKAGASFSIYMAHGGTTFGLWAGADRPFKPDTSSYDYDAPVSEAGWIGEKFELTRKLMASYLLPGETIPAPPAKMPVASLPEFKLLDCAPIFQNLPEAVKEAAPRHMEAYDQGQGCMVYRTTLPAGPAATLRAERAHDFAWVFVDGKQVGVMDRRARRFDVKIPARSAPTQVDFLVEAMGHVNFGQEIHDRKGLFGPIKLLAATGETALQEPWQVYNLPLSSTQFGNLKWGKGSAASGPAFWRGSFEVARPADTFLDLTTWGKGVIWINGRCLARFWNIGPTQTAYLPGAWLKQGRNELVILDLTGPEKPVVRGLEKPILDQLRPDKDLGAASPFAGKKLNLRTRKPVQTGSFKAGSELQEVRFAQPAKGRQFCLELLNAHDGKPHAAIAELDLLGPDGQSLSHVNWTIAYADSEERAKEDGAATNAIDGQSANFWHTEWSNAKPDYPHYLAIDLGETVEVTGFRYTPRQGNAPGRSKDWRAYIGEPFEIK
jgi:beta-galactosidase